MPQPEVKQGSAEAHRQESAETTQEPDQPDADVDDEVAELDAESDTSLDVEVGGGGGDPDDPDMGGGGGDGGGGSFFGSKKVIALIVVAIVVALFIAYVRGGRAGGTGNSNPAGETANPGKNGDRPEGDVNSVDEIDDALVDAPADREYTVPGDQNDPLAADEYVLNSTDIFPSVGDSGG